MRLPTPFGVFGFIAIAASLAAPADAATITGTVTGPDGAPFRGAFVQARHAGLKMTVRVLTDNQGRYIAENLPEGDYRVGVHAIGYRADVRAGVKLVADQNAAFDFALGQLLFLGERARTFLIGVTECAHPVEFRVADELAKLFKLSFSLPRKSDDK